MNTTENNKLIAEFMHLAKQLHLFENPITGEYQEELEYHCDWNWLMEVVEKIESLGFKTSIEIGFCSIDGQDIYFETKDFNVSKIEAVYNACVEFINFYNQNLSNKDKYEIEIEEIERIENDNS